MLIKILNLWNKNMKRKIEELLNGLKIPFDNDILMSSDKPEELLQTIISQYLIYMYLINNKDVSEIEKALKSGIDPNTHCTDGQTPLHIAVLKNRLEIATLLLNHGANVNAIDNKNYSPLHFAVMTGNLEIIKLLLDHKAEFKDLPASRHPFFLAASLGNIEAMKLLIQYGADPKQIYKPFNETALHAAAHNDNVDAVKFLLELGLDVNANSEFGTPLYYAHDSYTCMNGISNLSAEMWLKPNPIPSPKLNLNVISLLLEKGANPNIGGKYIHPIHLAALGKNISLVKQLIKHGADPKAGGEGVNGLHYAIVSGSFELVDLFLQSGIDINSNPVPSYNKENPICIALKTGNLEMTNFLLQKGAVLILDEPYIIEAGIRNLDTFKFLLERGLKLDYKDQKGNTLLHKASDYGKIEVIKFLLEKGLDVNARNNNGEVATQKIYFHTSSENVKLFLDYGANVNNIDDKGYTPLHYLSINGGDNFEAFRLLLEAGANKDLIFSFSNNDMLIHVLAKKEYTKSMKIFFEYGGDIKPLYEIKFTDFYGDTKNRVNSNPITKLAKAINEDIPHNEILSINEIKEYYDTIFFALRAQLVNENDAKYINYSIENLLLIKPEVNIIDLILQANKGNVLNSFEVIAKSEAIQYLNEEDSFDNLKNHIIKEASSMEKDKVSEYLSSLKNKADFFKDGSIKDSILEVINSVTEDYKLPSLKILSLKSILGNIENDRDIDDTNDLEQPFSNMHGVYQEMIRDVILESNCIFSPQETKVKDHLLAAMNDYDA
jgi:ankyrin repeat protein